MKNLIWAVFVCVFSIMRVYADDHSWSVRARIGEGFFLPNTIVSDGCAFSIGVNHSLSDEYGVGINALTISGRANTTEPEDVTGIASGVAGFTIHKDTSYFSLKAYKEIKVESGFLDFGPSVGAAYFSTHKFKVAGIVVSGGDAFTRIYRPAVGLGADFDAPFSRHWGLSVGASGFYAFNGGDLLNFAFEVGFGLVSRF